MRGFACLLMFEVHGYDSWLMDSLRQKNFYRLSQFSGTIAAPIFLFLAGASLALVSDRMKLKGATPNQVERRLAWRGLEIVGLGYLLRLQEFVMGYKTASVDRSTARGHFERDRRFADVDGGAVEDLQGPADNGDRVARRFARQLCWRLRCCGLRCGRAGCLGTSRATSMACTRLIRRRPGCFRFFLGRRLRLRGWRWGVFFLMSGLPSMWLRRLGGWAFWARRFF